MSRDPYDLEPSEAEAIYAVADRLTSPNEEDRNGEPANVVDGLFAIARAIERLAKAVEGKP